MNFIDKITGNDMKRELRELNSRVSELPSDYQAAWKELEYYLWPQSNLTGRNLMPIFENCIELLEIAAADGESVDEIFANDIKGFCDAMLDKDTAKTWDYRENCRKSLNRTVLRKLGRG